MKNSHAPKAKPEDFRQRPPAELPMSEKNWKDFERGVKFFNEKEFWHSHEAWEEVWKHHGEDERLFFQGLIQLAAAYHHLLIKKSYRGLMNNFEKAYAKLEVFLPEYLGVPVRPLLTFIEKGREEAERVGEDGIDGFNTKLIPKLQFRKPSNPDFVVEVKDLIESPRFKEGVRLFNSGYYWEAHEAWEDVWRQHEADVKIFAQAFVQMAAAYSFVRLGKVSSAFYLFGKSIDKFEQFEHENCIVRIVPLLEAMRMTLSTLEQTHANGNVPIRISGVPLIAVPEE